jgi:type VII secretion protein EccB
VATKKDLVEAHSFSRRRLVTAFLSGAPGGREVEPSRPGRTVVGGVALAVLMVAGAAIASVLASRTEEDWNQVGLVVSREEAAPYVILEASDPPTLYPVINITSAQLILGADLDPTYVDQDVIENQTPGDTIGIAGAPQTLPRPRQFIESGWTACTGDGLGIQVDVSSQRKVSVPDNGGVVVVSGGQYWVIARSGSLDLDQRRAYRYQLPSMPSDENLLAGLGLDNTAEAPEVPAEWLSLFPEGAPLDLSSFGVADYGKPLPANVTGFPPGARVGDYVLNADETEGVFITNEGTASPLSGFALTVYRNAIDPTQPLRGAPNQLDIDLPQVQGAARAYGSAHWPDERLDEVRGQVCARLDARHDDVPRVDLAATPRGGAEVADTVVNGQKEVSIDRGRGAFVRVGGWDDTTSTSAYVIDPRGQSYVLVGAETIDKLRYSDTRESLIPDSWLTLFPPGVALSTSQALCPPTVAAPQPEAGAPPDPEAESGCQAFSK